MEKKDPKTETILDPELNMGSSSESPSKSFTNTSQVELHPPPARSPADLSVHLTIGSSPGSPSNRSTNSSQPKSPSRPSTPTRSPEGSPVHLTLCSSPESLSTSNNISSQPTRPPADSHVHLTIGSSPESAPKSNFRRSETKPPSPSTRSPVESPARSSVSSDHITLTNGYSPREEKAPASHPEKTRGGPSMSKSVHGEPLALVKIDQTAGENGKMEEVGGGGGGGGSIGGSRRKTRPPLSILRRGKREKMVKRAAFGFRALGALLCLVSFSVMAANKNMGWALDSFYRYKEFRYFISVNVIGFVYSATQAFDLAFHLATGKYALKHPYRCYFDFAIDQIITYLLISASSSATTRIDDWKSNWGNDKFPDLATASVSISYLAFVALAFSSLISGYTLCTSKSMQF